MEQKLKTIMADVFEVPDGEIDENSSPHVIPNWDSLKHVDLVLALQNEFGIRFENEEIPAMVNFQVILNTLRAYLE